VTICARTPFEELVVEVPGGRTLVSRPTVLTEPRRAETVDWAITVTKAYDTAGAARWLARLVGPATRVAIVQNGVEHLERFAGALPEGRTLPVIVDIPAERSGPGRILQRRHGDITVPDGELGAAFVTLFEGTALTPTTTNDFLTASWRKLALNSASVVNALALRPAGRVRSRRRRFRSVARWGPASTTACPTRSSRATSRRPRTRPTRCSWTGARIGRWRSMRETGSSSGSESE